MGQCVLWAQSGLTLCDPMDIQSMEFSRPESWSGSLSLLQGTFPMHGSNPGLPHCRWFFTSWATGKPKYIYRNMHLYTFPDIHWRRRWQPTPVFLCGEFHGQRSLEGYSPWGHTQSDTTKWLNNKNSWWHHSTVFRWEHIKVKGGHHPRTPFSSGEDAGMSPVVHRIVHRVKCKYDLVTVFI